MTTNDDTMRYACERIEHLAQKLGATATSEHNLMELLDDREARLSDLENRLTASQAKESDARTALDQASEDYRSLQGLQAEQYRKLGQCQADVDDLRSRLETAEQDATEARQALAQKAKREPFQWPKDREGNVLMGEQIQAHIDRQQLMIADLRGELRESVDRVQGQASTIERLQSDIKQLDAQIADLTSVLPDTD